jgi:BirA family biotin operon repressor/biotin-[acetyl-CoA-carboxylase] ligase
MRRLTDREGTLAQCLRRTCKAACRVLYFDELPSTMDEAFTIEPAGGESTGSPIAALVAADGQTAGRGRFGRTWHSPPGSVSLSYLLAGGAPSVPYGMIAAYVLYRFLAEISDRVSLKWVNDVLWNGRKIAGILTEERAGKTVIGIGLNLNCSALPDDLAGRATSLALETGGEWDPLAVVCSLTGQLFGMLQRLAREGLPPLLEEWERAAAMTGRTVSIRFESGEKLEGRVAGIDYETGALIVGLPDGRERIVYDGSLHFENGSAPPF